MVEFFDYFNGDFLIGKGKVLERAERVEMIISDVDGVLTDGRIIWDSGGSEIKFFHVQDGVATSIARYAGLKIALISARNSPVTSTRAEELGIEELYQVKEDKLEAFQSILRKYGLGEKQVAYIGDDLHDIALLKRAGLAVSVPEAVPEVRRFAHYITGRSAGMGAFREVVELVLRARGLWGKVLEKFDY